MLLSPESAEITERERQREKERNQREREITEPCSPDRDVWLLLYNKHGPKKVEHDASLIVAVFKGGYDRLRRRHLRLAAAVVSMEDGSVWEAASDPVASAPVASTPVASRLRSTTSTGVAIRTFDEVLNIAAKEDQEDFSCIEMVVPGDINLATDDLTVEASPPVAPASTIVSAAAAGTLRIADTISMLDEVERLHQLSDKTLRLECKHWFGKTLQHESKAMKIMMLLKAMFSEDPIKLEEVLSDGSIQDEVENPVRHSLMIKVVGEDDYAFYQGSIKSIYKSLQEVHSENLGKKFTRDNLKAQVRNLSTTGRNQLQVYAGNLQIKLNNPEAPKPEMAQPKLDVQKNSNAIDGAQPRLMLSKLDLTAVAQPDPTAVAMRPPLHQIQQEKSPWAQKGAPRAETGPLKATRDIVT